MILVDLAAPARFGVAAALVVGGFLAAKLVRASLEGPLARRRTPSFGRVIARLISFIVGAAAVATAVTVAFPSVKPVDFFAGLGILSIAAGFAFQDILSNLLSGLLLLIRQPFQGGDQIEVNGHTGTVEGITIRETRLKTFDGQRVIIPNKDVYQSAIDVKTAFDARRTSIVVGVGYDDDLDDARGLALEAIASIDDVHAEPSPEALLVEFGGSSMDIDLRYWTDPDQHTVRTTRDRVIAAVKERFDQHDIDIPFPIRTVEVPQRLLTD